VRQGAKTSSFAEASEDLKALAAIEISPKHVERLTERLGREWAAKRDRDVELFKQDKLPRQYASAPAAAAVMLDGGRLLTRADDGRPGVHSPAWREPKYACCLSLEAKRNLKDPQPEPPSKFLDAERVRKLVSDIQERAVPGRARKAPAPAAARRKKLRRKHAPRPHVLVRTALATLERSEEFGYHVATEVFRRNLDQADFKACVCDGQAYNWSVWQTHLKPLGFIPVLDFLHLLAYLHGAAHASVKDSTAAWDKYNRWLHWAWAGKVDEIIARLERDAKRLGEAPKDTPENDPRRIVSSTLTYLRNNRERMNYPRYRLLGLPVSSAPVESLIKQFNRRVKGTEKFWLEGGGEAVLQVRAAYLSGDDRANRLWTSSRPHQRAVGQHRLGT
jgi:hypothetical protein